MNIEKRFEEIVTQQLPPKSRFGIAVSGGVDSMTLLHLATRLKDENHWEPIVLHLNHGLRGEASERDARLVTRVANKLHLPVWVKNVQVQRISKREKISIEEAGRRARLSFFGDACRKYNFKKVLLAHHEDDLLETIMIRLFRGTGPRGIQAMRETAQHGPVTLVRPMLGITKSEILKYARKRKIRFYEDASNEDEVYFRNKIRLKVIPYLIKHLGHGTFRKLLDFRTSLANVQDYLHVTADSAFKKTWKRKGGKFHARAHQYKKLHPALQYETLNRAFQSLTGSLLEHKDWILAGNVIKGKKLVVNLRKNRFLRLEEDFYILS